MTTCSFRARSISARSRETQSRSSLAYSALSASAHARLHSCTSCSLCTRAASSLAACFAARSLAVSAALASAATCWARRSSTASFAAALMAAAALFAATSAALSVADLMEEEGPYVRRVEAGLSATADAATLPLPLLPTSSRFSHDGADLLGTVERRSTNFNRAFRSCIRRLCLRAARPRASACSFNAAAVAVCSASVCRELSLNGGVDGLGDGNGDDSANIGS